MGQSVAPQELVLLFIGLQGSNIGVQSSDGHCHRMSHQESHHWHEPTGVKDPYWQCQRQNPQTCKRCADEQSNTDSRQQFADIQFAAFQDNPTCIDRHHH